ncbi:hypothetical protein DFP72DRAFT_940614 [Ephemerocybe angulata]|uniref:Zn(2)-C6 fungal-type domain-containing protein n=1 Tax=Ephemerocybe angulata TaxID=980116 RepID=A0A8H6LTV5_9AGAR|nr:hypothetical protein DFP72DRAFT_940614 [Tulosesus angulatus]
MENITIDTFRRSSVGESSNASTTPGKEPEGQAYAGAHEPFAGKLRPPSKATRRIRGEIACAECRRLKIKCDRVVPCSTCVKRGCAALCPNGTIPPGEGSRFVLAATDHLREKISQLEARMHGLEDALAVANAPYSVDPHPLLVRNDDHSPVDDEGFRQASNPNAGNSPRNSPGLGEPMGTILVDGKGGSRFFGPSGGSESLLMSHEIQLPSLLAPNGPVKDLDPSYLPPIINQCYQSFPFTATNASVDAKAVQATTESYLPAMERATALCSTCLENLASTFDINFRKKLFNELIPAIYRKAAGEYGPHELSLLFVVLAIGCLLDLALPPYSLEAQHYYRLAGATLTLQPVLGEQSFTAVQALHLMSIYDGMTGNESNLEKSYALLDLAGQVAIKVGLHVDPSSWGFQGPEAYARRLYFWSLISDVLWQSLVTGRPPSILTSSIQCRVPSLKDEELYRHEEPLATYGTWQLRVDSECLVPLSMTLLSAKPPSYGTILELDKKIRENSILREDLVQNHNPHTDTALRIFSRVHYQDLMLMFLHRAYFAEAMSEFPDDPLGSPYGYSVRAAYSSACVVLQDTRDLFLKKPILCPRIWRVWSFAFTAALMVGSVAIRGAHCGLSPPALEELDATWKTFEGAAKGSGRVYRGAIILRSMYERALACEKEGPGGPGVDRGTDILSFLSGQARGLHPCAAESIRGSPERANTPRQGLQPTDSYLEARVCQPMQGGEHTAQPEAAPAASYLPPQQFQALSTMSGAWNPAASGQYPSTSVYGPVEFQAPPSTVGSIPAHTYQNYADHQQYASGFRLAAGHSADPGVNTPAWGMYRR